MTIEEVVQIILPLLEEYGIDYMVVGSLASNIHGVPRATQDADIVIECNKTSLERFIDAVHDQFYADKHMALEALRRRSMFNVIHYESGFKIDLIVRKMDQFNTEEFARRIHLPFRGTKRWIATPEDVILSKLDWSMLSESERQFSDAVNVALVQRNTLDFDYLRKWAKELEIEPLLQKLLTQLKIST